jgi:hypothetical protein
MAPPIKKAYNTASWKAQNHHKQEGLDKHLADQGGKGKTQSSHEMTNVPSEKVCDTGTMPHSMPPGEERRRWTWPAGKDQFLQLSMFCREGLGKDPPRRKDKEIQEWVEATKANSRQSKEQSAATIAMFSAQEGTQCQRATARSTAGQHDRPGSMAGMGAQFDDM